MIEWDWLIIGSGAAAMAAALQASAQGQSVALLEQATLGGTCVNVGCIPSKILYSAAKVAQQRRHSGFDQVVSLQEPQLDWAALQHLLQQEVSALRQLKYANPLAAQANIQFMQGRAELLAAHLAQVTSTGAEPQILRFKQCLLAVGAKPYLPPIAGLADSPYWTSTEALTAQQLPKSLLVLGGSVVALELAQAFARFGVQVTLLARRTLLADEEPLLGQTLKACLQREGVRVVEGVTPTAVTWQAAQGFQLQSGSGQWQAEQLLIACGRQPAITGLGLESLGVARNEQGAIKVDAQQRTSVAGIYAAGDCCNQPQLVYVAAKAGKRAVQGVAETGQLVPRVMFTDPQLATVGLSEAQARKQGYQVVSRYLPAQDIPRGRVSRQCQGFIKMVAEAGSLRLLGVQALLPEAGELIQTASLAMQAEWTTSQLAAGLFPYLTWSEGLKLVAQAFTQEMAKLSCCAG